MKSKRARRGYNPEHIGALSTSVTESGIGAVLVHEEAVLAANDAFYRAFNQKDQHAMEALWANSVPVHCIHPGWNVLSGREPVVESWRRILSNEDQPKLLTGGATATVMGDVAVVICREFVAGTPLAATNVFVREEGDWKLVHHHSGPVAVMGQ